MTLCLQQMHLVECIEESRCFIDLCWCVQGVSPRSALQGIKPTQLNIKNALGNLPVHFLYMTDFEILYLILFMLAIIVTILVAYINHTKK